MTTAEWVKRWWADGAENTLRVNYPLFPGDVVLDVGAYDGSWTADLLRAVSPVRPIVYLFEPLPNMCRVIDERLKGADIRVVNAALSDVDGEGMIEDRSHESSMHLGGTTKIRTMDVRTALKEYSFSTIKLLSLNVEGHEYRILDRMIGLGAVESIEYLQIQFHEFVPGAVEKREAILAELSKTHYQVWNYPFVWESWKRRN